VRVLHCPVNTAGIPWANSQALRRRGIESDLLVFNRYKLHPEADISLERRGNLAQQQLTQWRAFLKLLPRYDVFHFYSSVTLVPKSVQFRILHALGAPRLQEVAAGKPRQNQPRRLPLAGAPHQGCIRSDDRRGGPRPVKRFSIRGLAFRTKLNSSW